MREIDDLTAEEQKLIKDGDIGIIECTVSELRAYLDGETDPFEDVATVFDNAQGNIFSGARKVELVVIRITPDGSEEEGADAEEAEELGDLEVDDEDEDEDEEDPEHTNLKEEPKAQGIVQTERYDDPDSFFKI